MRAPSAPATLAAEVRDAARSHGALLILSDFDGTLAPIAPSPADARLAPPVRKVLARLAGAPSTGLAVISGRDLADLRARSELPNAILAGCHGLVIEGPGLEFVHLQAAECRQMLAGLATELVERLGGLRGVEVEPKEYGVAVHYRRAYPSDLAEVFFQVEEARENYAPHLTTRPGKKVLELVPNVPWNKGECALWIRDRWARQHSLDPTVVYIGDDETDESAFQALRGKAITVRVGSGHRGSRAARWVTDVSAVHRFLGALAPPEGAESEPPAAASPNPAASSRHE
ncbi:MAG TPA: trehalose-phosphatase [Methylomirabilota bacterium]|nr:trehalose-phosphatase [Methylomirabilota bacterium]